MATYTKENYLKAIFHLERQHEKVTVTQVSEAMEVSNSTTNSMIKKLQDAGWIDYKKYKPIQLTAEGRKKAALIVRKHRLTEMFLVDIMGFHWDEVHQIAEEIEHLKSPPFFDRMAQLLGHPTVDPHGSPIPDKEGNMRSHSYQLLSSFQKGCSFELYAVRDTSIELLQLLSAKGIALNTILTIDQIEPYDSSMTVNIDGEGAVILSAEVTKRLLGMEV